MKKKLLGFLTGVVAFATAISPVSVMAAKTPEGVVVKKNKVVVTYTSNASTGCSWLVGVDGDKVVKHVKTKYISPKFKNTEIAPVGAAGKEKMTFKGIKKGTATIVLAYGKAWDTSEIYDSKTLVVKVKKGGKIKSVKERKPTQKELDEFFGDANTDDVVTVDEIDTEGIVKDDNSSDKDSKDKKDKKDKTNKEDLDEDEDDDEDDEDWDDEEDDDDEDDDEDWDDLDEDDDEDDEDDEE